MDCCPGQTVIRVKKKFIHENIIYFYNHVSALRHMQHVQYKHYTVTVHSEDTCWWTYTNSWQWKKNGKKNFKNKPKNKTTRSTMQLSSNTAASCDINLFTHKLPFDFTFDKKSVIAVRLVKLTMLAIYMMQNAIHHFSAFDTTHHLSRSYIFKIPWRVANYYLEFA